MSVALYGSYYAFDYIGPLAPLLSRQLHFSDSQIGLLQAVYSVPNIVAMLVCGVIIDRIGTRRSMAIFGVLVFAGLAITGILLVKKIKGSILAGIVLTSLLAWPIGRWWGGSVPVITINDITAAPDFSLLFKLDIIHSLQWSMVPVIFAFVFTDMFDSLSTFVGLSEAAGLMDENGEPRNIKRSLVVDAFSTTIAGLAGSSPGTAYIESAVGIEQGGRTGLTAITGAVLFLPFLFLSPLISAVPAIATAPALVLVGVFMMRPVVKINWMRASEAVPAFIAMVLIPFTYSITQGIIWGFLGWTVMQVAAGRSREISIALWVIDLFAVAALVI